MAATYDPLLSTDRDKARSLLGDTQFTPTTQSDALHSDEHINAVLVQQGSLALAIAWLADELVARFSQEPVRIGLSGTSVDYSARIPTWQTLATRMRADGLPTPTPPPDPNAAHTRPRLFVTAPGRRAYRR